MLFRSFEINVFAHNGIILTHCHFLGHGAAVFLGNVKRSEERRGGKECLMPGANAAAAEVVATRICAEIKSEKVRLKDARKDGTTASIGLATMAASGGAASAEQMIATAIDSLAKAQGAGAAQIVAQELRLAA